MFKEKLKILICISLSRVILEKKCSEVKECV